MPRGKLIDLSLYIDKLASAIQIGATYQLAALYAGISHDTFLRWRKKAEKAPEGSDLARLRDRLQEAEGRAAIGWLARIEQEANNGDWKAAAWKLERRYPETYGRTFQKLAFTDPSGDQTWEGTTGLAALLEAARTARPSSNGSHPHVTAEEDD
jgi:hypothetical protein